MNVSLKKTMSGKIIVTYDCPHCASPLKSNVSEIDMEDTCPKCATQFLVPGKVEYQRLLDQQKAKAEKERIEQEEHEKVVTEKNRQTSGKKLKDDSDISSTFSPNTRGQYPNDKQTTSPTQTKAKNSGGFIAEDLAPGRDMEKNMPVIKVKDLPPRAKSQISEGETVHCILYGSNESKTLPPGCGVLSRSIPTETKKTQNWFMITSEKIVCETQVHIITENPQLKTVDDTNEFEFYSAYHSDIVSIKAEVINSTKSVLGCNQSSRKSTSNCIVVNLTNGSFSSFIKSLDEALEVQKILVLLKKQYLLKQDNKS